jgi:tripartite-type tricarboxylate transporter receptor subunit TctC
MPNKNIESKLTMLLNNNPLPATTEEIEMKTRRSALLAACLMMGLGSIAQAQEPQFPSKTMKIIVPFTAGGPTDLIARVVSQVLQKAFNQTVVVENKPGAGGAVGTRFVAQAEPNGLTLLLGTVATLGALPAVQKNAGYDPVKSFAPVSKVTESTTVLVASADAPFKTVPELVAYARANPQKINYASAGIGNQTQLNAELFKARTKTNIQHIPYKSGNEMLTALLSKDAQVAFLDISFVMSYIKEGKLIPLAVTGKSRTNKLPEIPTMVEAGVPDFSATFWTGILAPAGTPAPIVAKLNAAINAGISSPEMRAMLANISADPTPLSPQEFGVFIGSEYQKWRDIVQSAGITEE